VNSHTSSNGPIRAELDCTGLEGAWVERNEGQLGAHGLCSTADAAVLYNAAVANQTVFSGRRANKVNQSPSVGLFPFQSDTRDVTVRRN